jgi:hypothetical protein
VFVQSNIRGGVGGAFVAVGGGLRCHALLMLGCREFLVDVMLFLVDVMLS